jgi:hypothetical protein
LISLASTLVEFLSSTLSPKLPMASATPEDVLGL